MLLGRVGNFLRTLYAPQASSGCSVGESHRNVTLKRKCENWFELSALTSAVHDLMARLEHPARIKSCNAKRPKTKNVPAPYKTGTYNTIPSVNQTTSLQTSASTGAATTLMILMIYPATKQYITCPNP
jgi:hypothetical protein